MPGLVMQERANISSAIFADSAYIDVSRNRNFLIRSEDSVIDKLFLEFDALASDIAVREILEYQMKYYLSHINTEWISVLIWEDNVNTVISLFPITGAA